LIHGLIERTADLVLQKPRTVHISPTYRCTLKCMQCDLWRLPNDGELSSSRWIGVIKAFKEYLGPFALKISGGEPFLVPGMMELVERAKAMDLYVGISTNGTLLNDETARRIVRAGVDEVHVSIDSMNPKIHDHMRGAPLAFKRAMQAIERLASLNGETKICLATVITSLNLEGLMDLVIWAANNPGLYTITLQALFQNFGAPYDPAWWKRSELWPRDRDLVTSVFDRLMDYKSSHWELANPMNQLAAMKDYFLHPDRTPTAVCHAGKTDIAVDPFGGLRLCFSLPPIGNLLRSSPGRLLHSKEAAKRRKQIASCKRSCNLLNCNYEDVRRDSSP